jgi:hypothetical protein
MPIGRTTGCFVLFYATSTVVETFVSAGLHHACAMAQLLPSSGGKKDECFYPDLHPDCGTAAVEGKQN